MGEERLGELPLRSGVKVEFDAEILDAALACMRAIEAQRQVLHELVSQHRIRDPAWKGQPVIPLRRLK